MKAAIANPVARETISHLDLLNIPLLFDDPVAI